MLLGILLGVVLGLLLLAFRSGPVSVEPKWMATWCVPGNGVQLVGSWIKRASQGKRDNKGIKLDDSVERMNYLQSCRDTLNLSISSRPSFQSCSGLAVTLALALALALSSCAAWNR